MPAKKITFQTTIHKFDKKGEKTGWTYIEVPADISSKLFPGNRKSFRVTGTIDSFAISKVALIPMGDQNFIMALNASIRKGLRKGEGATVRVSLSRDKEALPIDKDLLACLEDDEKAKKAFEKLPMGHRNYFSKWIESAKTSPTKTKRIAMTLDALARGLDFGAMLRASRDRR